MQAVRKARSVAEPACNVVKRRGALPWRGRRIGRRRPENNARSTRHRNQAHESTETELIQAAAACLSAGVSIGRSQSAPNKTVGILAPSTRAKELVTLEPFFAEMRRLGWVEHRNIAYDWALGDDQELVLPRRAAELVARKPDLIYAPPAPAASAARRATASIPIVFATADQVRTRRQPADCNAARLVGAVATAAEGGSHHLVTASVRATAARLAARDARNSGATSVRPLESAKSPESRGLARARRLKTRAATAEIAAMAISDPVRSFEIQRAERLMQRETFEQAGARARSLGVPRDANPFVKRETPYVDEARLKVLAEHWWNGWDRWTPRRATLPKKDGD